MSIGPVMLDLDGLEISAEEQELLQQPLVGGVILFQRNYASPRQLQELIQAIRSCRKPLLIAVDQEGGRVQRFRKDFIELPPMQQFGKYYDEAPLQAKQLAKTCGWIMASELLAYTVDFSFAPVLDIDYGISAVIGNRAFHKQPGGVADLAQAFWQGMHEAGMAGVGKHFPGHGFVAADSHTDIPTDLRSYQEIAGQDLETFKNLIQQGLEGIMPAHIIYSAVDSKPAGFSAYWLQDILRRQLHFSGVIFSDDLNMAGASGMGSYAERAKLALAAGCDMILICNQRQGAYEILKSLSVQSGGINPRLQAMQGHSHYKTRDDLYQSLAWQKAVTALQIFNHEYVT